MDGRYEIAAETVIGAPADEVMRWLTEPDRMCRWMTGVSFAEPGEADHQVRLTASAGAYAGWTFIGEIVRRSDDTLVRAHRLEHLRAGVAPVAVGDQEYERVVTYTLTPAADGRTHVACTAVTTIPGLHAAAARAGAKAEQKALERSLDRLRAALGGERRGIVDRWRDSTPTASPL